MMISNREVAKLRPIPPQLATQEENIATLIATNTQPKRKIDLKGLADKVLLRNQERNQHEKPSKNGAQLCAPKNNEKCASLLLEKQGKMDHVAASKKPCRKVKSLPSPVALAWLHEHRQALDVAGWTRSELYRRNKSNRGIAWYLIWDKPFLLAYLHESGVIEFEFSDGGRDVFQTAHPIANAPRY